MRIISGTVRGKRLATFDGTDVRPTADRVREALFSILVSKLGTLTGLQVLDLFSGTGALALEALSRGAASALLIDQDPKSLAIARQNITACRMEQTAKAVRGVLPGSLDLLPGESFDLIFIDPPYAKGLIPPLLSRIAALELLSENGMVVTECGRGEQLADELSDLRRIDQRHYGATTISFYERIEASA